MKDLGPLTYFLELEIQRSSIGIHVHQWKYVEDLIELAGLMDSLTGDTPLELNVKYRKDKGISVANPTLFRQLVGTLILSFT